MVLGAALALALLVAPCHGQQIELPEDVAADGADVKDLTAWDAPDALWSSGSDGGAAATAGGASGDAGSGGGGSKGAAAGDEQLAARCAGAVKALARRHAAAKAAVRAAASGGDKAAAAAAAVPVLPPARLRLGFDSRLPWCGANWLALLSDDRGRGGDGQGPVLLVASPTPAGWRGGVALGERQSVRLLDCGATALALEAARAAGGGGAHGAVVLAPPANFSGGLGRVGGGGGASGAARWHESGGPAMRPVPRAPRHTQLVAFLERVAPGGLVDAIQAADVAAVGGGGGGYNVSFVLRDAGEWRLRLKLLWYDGSLDEGRGKAAAAGATSSARARARKAVAQYVASTSKLGAWTPKGNDLGMWHRTPLWGWPNPPAHTDPAKASDRTTTWRYLGSKLMAQSPAAPQVQRLKPGASAEKVCGDLARVAGEPLHLIARPAPAPAPAAVAPVAGGSRRCTADDVAGAPGRWLRFTSADIARCAAPLGSQASGEPPRDHFGAGTYDPACTSFTGDPSWLNDADGWNRGLVWVPNNGCRYHFPTRPQLLQCFDALKIRKIFFNGDSLMREQRLNFGTFFETPSGKCNHGGSGGGGAPKTVAMEGSRAAAVDDDLVCLQQPMWSGSAGARSRPRNAKSDTVVYSDEGAQTRVRVVISDTEQTAPHGDADDIMFVEQKKGGKGGKFAPTTELYSPYGLWAVHGQLWNGDFDRGGSYAETLQVLTAKNPDVILFDIAIPHAEWIMTEAHFVQAVHALAGAWTRGGFGKKVRWPILFVPYAAFGPKQDFLSNIRQRRWGRIAAAALKPAGWFVVNAEVPTAARPDSTNDGLHYHLFGNGGVASMVTTMMMNLLCNPLAADGAKKAA